MQLLTAKKNSVSEYMTCIIANYKYFYIFDSQITCLWRQISQKMNTLRISSYTEFTCHVMNWCIKLNTHSRPNTKNSYYTEFTHHVMNWCIKLNTHSRPNTKNSYYTEFTCHVMNWCIKLNAHSLHIPQSYHHMMEDPCTSPYK